MGGCQVEVGGEGGGEGLDVQVDVGVWWVAEGECRFGEVVVVFGDGWRVSLEFVDVRHLAWIATRRV